MPVINQDITEIKAAAVAEVNAAAETARKKYITGIAGQESVYRFKEAEATAYVATAPEPGTLEAFPFIEKEVGITAPTAYEVAQVFLNLAAQWVVLGAEMEGVRISAAEGIKAASLKADVDAVLETFHAAISAF